MYSSSAWIFIGGLNYDLSEGDVITVFSQYGEVVNINLIRDQKTGKSKGFCFLCYEDQRSTVLAVDNLNAIKLLNRVIRVDHVSQYKIPKEHEDIDDITRRLYTEGCAPKEVVIKEEPEDEVRNKSNKSSKIKKHKKRHRRSSSRDSSSSSSSASSDNRSKRRNKSKHLDKTEDKRRDKTRSHSKDKRDKNKYKSKKD